MAYQGYVQARESPIRQNIGVYEGGARRQERLSKDIGTGMKELGESVKDFATHSRAQEKLGMYDQQRRLNTAMAAHKLSLEDVDRKLYKNHGSRAAALEAFTKREAEWRKASSDPLYKGNLASDFADMYRDSGSWKGLTTDADGKPLDPKTLPKVSFGEWLRQGEHIDEAYLNYDHTPTLSMIKEVVSEIQGRDVGDIFDRVAVDPGKKKESGLDGVYEETKDGETIKTGQSSGGLTINDSDFAAVKVGTSAEEIGKQLGNNKIESESNYQGMKDYRDYPPPLTQEELNKGKQDLELFENLNTETPTKEADVLSGAATKSDTSNVINLDEEWWKSAEADTATEAVTDEGITKINRGYWGGKGLSDEEVNNLQSLADLKKEDVEGWATDKSGKKLRSIYLKGLLEYLPGGINDLKKMPKLMKVLSDPSYDPAKWEPPTGDPERSMGSQWFELFGEAEADVSGDIKVAIDKFHQDFSKEFLMNKEVKSSNKEKKKDKYEGATIDYTGNFSEFLGGAPQYRQKQVMNRLVIEEMRSGTKVSVPISKLGMQPTRDEAMLLLRNKLAWKFKDKIKG